MPAGNRSVLAFLDSQRVADRVCADRTVFAALDHFGAAYEVLECSDYMTMPVGHAAPRAAYVIAHDGAGAAIEPKVATQIVRAVQAGAGLISFDREVNDWPEPLRAVVTHVVGRRQVETLRFAEAPSFITFGHEPGEEVELDRPLTVTTFCPDRFRPMLTTANRECVALSGRVGQGRVVLFGSGEELYADDVFGHTRGLDGLMWRALVWAAAKPFPMRCVPPFVTARFDDCNGAHSAFGWVGALNRHGISPNVGLFIDELGPTDWKAVTQLYEKRGADFSMHAFRDDSYKANPKYKPYAVLPDKPDLSNRGKATKFEGLSLDHYTGRDLDDATIKHNFERMDNAFAAAGIKHSRLINAHFGEIAWRAAPLFLERGADIPVNNSVIGQLYGNQPPWRPRPYGCRGRNGRHGLIIDRPPHLAEFCFVSISSAHVGSSHMTTDILSGHVPFLAESDAPRLQDAAHRGIANIKLGLDCLAFGKIMTHEERIDAISPEDWDWVVDAIMRGLEGWDFRPAAREDVGTVCQRLFDSRLVYADATDAGLHCEFSGLTNGPSPLTVWANDGDACTRRVVEIGPIDGFAEADVE